MQFYDLHPFHLLLDSQCRLLQCGSVIARLLPSVRQGDSLEAHFKVGERAALWVGRGILEADSRRLTEVDMEHT